MCFVVYSMCSVCMCVFVCGGVHVCVTCVRMSVCTSPVCVCVFWAVSVARIHRPQTLKYLRHSVYLTERILCTYSTKHSLYTYGIEHIL